MKEEKKEKQQKPVKKQKGMRTGFGYDIHRMVDGRPLFIGGINIPHTKGLLGHSDGDALLHAACDAVLGAVCKGEIGVYFPPTDFSFMGIDSKIIAEKTMGILKEEGGKIENMDIVIIAEAPKLVMHYAAIKKSMAAIFKTENINIKAKSHEGMGELGKGEALECMVSVLITLK